MIFSAWTTPLALLRLELIQRDYEGHPVPEGLKEQVAALDGEKRRDELRGGGHPLQGARQAAKGSEVHLCPTQRPGRHSQGTSPTVPDNSAASLKRTCWTSFTAPGPGAPSAAPSASRLKAWESGDDRACVDDRPSGRTWKTGSTGRWTITSVAWMPVTTCGSAAPNPSARTSPSWNRTMTSTTPLSPARS